MNVVIKINNIDATSAVSGLSKIPIYARNYDFSQVFTDMNFTLSYKFKRHGEIKEGSTIVEAFIDDNCVYTGYVDSATRSGFYLKKIKVKHITQKLKEIKPLEDAKDVTGVYNLRPEFVFTGQTFNCSHLLDMISQMIGYTAVQENNYINRLGELANVFEYIPILYNVQYWGQDVEFNEDQEKISFVLDPEKSPSLWDLLVLLQKTLNFSCRFESVFSTNKFVNITTPGHFWATDLQDIPAQGEVDPSFNGLKEKINIINNNLLSDIPTNRAVKKESSSIINNYIDFIFYFSTGATETPEKLTQDKSYNSIKYKETKKTYPEHFVFIPLGSIEAGMGSVPFVLNPEFSPIQEKYTVTPGPISIYSRWMNYQDYADVGSFSAGFQRAAVSYQDVKYYLTEWDGQILTKLPRKIDYNTKNKVFEITQDEPERN